MPALKCPNPSCSFLFDPTQVPPGAVLTCPRCTMRFTLGPPPGDPPPPTLPAAEPSEATATETNEPPRPSRRDGGLPILVTIGGVMLLFGVIGAALYVSMWFKRDLTGFDNSSGPSESVIEDLNFAYKFPGPPWVQDQETKNALNSHAFALRRTEPPEARAALEVSDFGNQSPTEAELHDRMTEQLGRVFLNLPMKFELEATKWAGLDARKCAFRGEHRKSGMICTGECYLLSHQGIGYWFYTWAAERDAGQVAAEFDDLRGRFRILKNREGVGPAATPVHVIRPDSGRYQLASLSAIWNKPKGLTPTDEDPKADLLMVGELPRRLKRDSQPRATLVVFILPDGDPDEVADQYIRKRQARDPEVFGPTKFTELTGPVEGDVQPPERPDGPRVVRLQVTPGGENAFRSSEKLVVYAAIKAGGEVIAAEASCPWSERALWENRLVQLVGSLRE